MRAIAEGRGMWALVTARDWKRAVMRRHGRKQGLVRSMKAQVGLLLGRYAACEAIDWGRVERVVFVCKGNVCRSPYAEARARQLGLDARSFGLQAGRGRPADEEVGRQASSRGIDLSAHRSSPLPEIALGAGDLVAAMEPAQLPALAGPVAHAGGQLTLLGLWGERPRAHIEDPFGLPGDYLATCLETIDDAVAGLAWRLGRRA